jgi:hypothetical protein
MQMFKAFLPYGGFAEPVPAACERTPTPRDRGLQLRLICTANAQRAAQTSNSSILVNAGSGWRYISAKTIRAMIYRQEGTQ